LRRPGRRFQAPLGERKELLSKILGESPDLVESRYIQEKGRAFFQEAVAQGLEGIMAKSLSSPYLVGKRSRYWLKMKPRGQALGYIVGYSAGQGARRRTFGSLAVATVEEGRWVFRGMVGSGFTDEDLEAIAARLQGLETAAPPIPLSGRVKGVTWVRPELKCQVTFQEKTGRGHFRAPAFQRLVE
jgi:bifunctional non-homologous end joining protein LigD